MIGRRSVLSAGVSAAVLVYGYMVVNVSFYRPVPGDPPPQKNPFPVYSGAVHVHSRYSDGSGSFTEIAQAAKRDGLDFVIVTDHGSGTDAGARAGYYDDVLVMTGSETARQEGHFLYIPHPDSVFYENDYVKKNYFELRDEALLIGAHPYLPKRPMETQIAPDLHGIEVVNTDAQWRSTSTWNLIQAFLVYPVLDYSMNIIAHFTGKPMQLWKQTLNNVNSCVLIGSTDAHANIAVTRTFHWKFPSYEKIFQQVQTHVIADEPFTGDYRHDARLVYSALRSGKSYISFENFSDSRGFLFTAVAGDTVVTMGDAVDLSELEKIRITVPGGPDVRVYLETPGETVAVADGHDVEFLVHKTGKYFVEVYQVRQKIAAETEIPWIITNAIYVQ